jgi:hypothetical protein
MSSKTQSAEGGTINETNNSAFRYFKEEVENINAHISAGVEVCGERPGQHLTFQQVGAQTSADSRNSPQTDAIYLNPAGTETRAFNP